jgi:hypothetical protein
VRKQGKVAQNRRILNNLRAEEVEESESESESESEDEGFIGVAHPKPKPAPGQVDHTEFHDWLTSLKHKK